MSSTELLESEQGLANDGIEIKELPLALWPQLKESFIALGCEVMPDPSHSSILVAVEGSEILGFVVLQTLLHVEPLFTYPKAQGRQIWKKLYDRVDEILPHGMVYIITTESPVVMKRALARNFKELGISFGKVIDKSQLAKSQEA